MPLADYVFDQLSILKSLRKHEIATDSLRVLIVSGALEVVALLQGKELSLTVVYKVTVVLQLARQLCNFDILFKTIIFHLFLL